MLSAARMKYILTVNKVNQKYPATIGTVSVTSEGKTFRLGSEKSERCFLLRHPRKPVRLPTSLLPRRRAALGNKTSRLDTQTQTQDQ